MTNYEMLINTLIAETLATADSDPSTTWDDFYQTLSDDAKSGYSALIDEVCSYEETEDCEKFIDTDDVFEAIVTSDKTTAKALVDFLVEHVLSDLEWEAEKAEQARYDAECERADLAYKRMIEERMDIC